MRLALAFRLLLLLAFLGNAIGGAYAMGNMAVPSAPEVTHGATHSACHGHREASAPQEKLPASPRGCCPDGACTCSCLGLAAIPGVPGLPVDGERHVLAPITSLASAHLPPSLSHLLRPPIG